MVAALGRTLATFNTVLVDFCRFFSIFVGSFLFWFILVDFCGLMCFFVDLCRFLWIFVDFCGLL
jgi:hypothetical protein